MICCIYPVKLISIFILSKFLKFIHGIYDELTNNLIPISIVSKLFVETLIYINAFKLMFWVRLYFSLKNIFKIKEASFNHG